MYDVLEKLKEYLQFRIDNGYYKIYYDDSMNSLNNIDCIKAIESIIAENKKLRGE